MRFINDPMPAHEQTFSEVFLAPSFSDVTSRMDVDLRTPDRVGTSIPIVVANMTAVAGRRMAETVARRGGVAVLPQDVEIEAIADMVASVKRAHRVVRHGPHAHPAGQRQHRPGADHQALPSGGHSGGR